MGLLSFMTSEDRNTQMANGRSVFSHRMRLIILLATVAGLLGALSDFKLVAIPSAIVLVLLAPGIVLMMVIDPDRSLLRFETTFFWGLFGSFAIVILGGLLLNAVASLDRLTWLIYLCAVTLTLLAISQIRDTFNWKARKTESIVAPITIPIRIRATVIVAAALALALIVVSSKHSSSSIPATALGSVIGSVDSIAKCPTVDATSTIRFESKYMPAFSNYAVIALGTVSNDSDRALYNVTITWQVTYADLSTGTPTRSPVTGYSIPKGGRANWGAPAGGNDGQVPPTSVRILRVSGAPAGTLCSF
jgi:hypothetical protein